MPILPDWLVSGLCWLMAIEFLLLAPFKFVPRGIFGQPSYFEKFRAWGYPPWFSAVVGAGEILAAILFLIPERRFLGATIIAVTMIGGMVTHQVNHDKLTDSIAAPIHFALATVVALSVWPADWRDPLTFAF